MQIQLSSIKFDLYIGKKECPEVTTTVKIVVKPDFVQKYQIGNELAKLVHAYYTKEQCLKTAKRIENLY